MKLLIGERSKSISARIAALAIEYVNDLEQIAVSSTFNDVIDKMNSSGFDALLLDAILLRDRPLNELNKLKLNNRHLILVIMTDFDDNEFRTVCLSNGADFFLSKNENFEILLNILRNIQIENEENLLLEQVL